MSKAKIQIIKKDNSSVPISDYRIESVLVDCYKLVFMDGKVLYVSNGVGEGIKEVMIKNENSDVIKLGAGVFRVYQFKEVIPAKVKFVALSDWAKYKVLQEQPHLLDGLEESFSLSMREWLDQLKEGKGDRQLRFIYPGDNF